MSERTGSYEGRAAGRAEQGTMIRHSSGQGTAEREDNTRGAEGQPETIHLCEYAGPEDNASAMAMITEAAVAYDKTSPASFSLDAFEGATMTPLVFREQLRRFVPSASEFFCRIT